jgi:hypothetical protein
MKYTIYKDAKAIMQSDCYDEMKDILRILVMENKNLHYVIRDNDCSITDPAKYTIIFKDIGEMNGEVDYNILTESEYSPIALKITDTKF